MYSSRDVESVPTMFSMAAQWRGMVLTLAMLRHTLILR